MTDSLRLMEPMLPSAAGLERLRPRAEQVVLIANRLRSAAHPVTRAALAELVRSMNSYYSNLIEGQGTHPLTIERALRADFSAEPDLARRQRLALAHISASKALEGLPTAEALTWKTAQRAHHLLFSTTATDEAREVMRAGELRTTDVSVGRHVAPAASTLLAFLSRFDELYGRDRSPTDQLIAIAAAHHRMAWIHPFLDGNGRAVRLQTHAAMHDLTGGLWSPIRGMGRERSEYYARLDAADSPRAGDLDGRGARSAKGLQQWCEWFVDVCLDQAEFVERMLQLDSLRTRIDALVAYWSVTQPGVRIEAALPLHHVFVAGPTSRAEFFRMTGLGERTARSALSRLLELGILTSSSHRAPVHISFPIGALRFLFPGLYPEADTPLSG